MSNINYSKAIMSHLMIDLETLATSNNPTILTFGAIRFDPFGDDSKSYQNGEVKMKTFYRRITTESCESLGLEVNDDTVDWWSKQDPEVIEEAFGPEDREDLQDVLKDFYQFSRGSDAVWSHGSIFDINIIENICKQINQSVSWKFWEIRDTRTLFALADPEMPDASKHHALIDCWRQIVGVQRSLQKLGLKDFVKR